jgi:hypothetical protein
MLLLNRGMKTVVTDQPQTSDKIVLESVVDTDKAFDSSKEWPFAPFCEDLRHDLFEYVFSDNNNKRQQHKEASMLMSSF